MSIVDLYLITQYTAPRNATIYTGAESPQQEQVNNYQRVDDYKRNCWTSQRMAFLFSGGAHFLAASEPKQSD